MPYVDATGAKLYFERVATVIRSSSSTNSHRTSRGWEAQMRYFPAATVASPIMPEATHPAMSPEMPLYQRCGFAVDDIAHFDAGACDRTRPHVVGLSMGGYAALQFGLRYPEIASAIDRSKRGIRLPPLPA